MQIVRAATPTSAGPASGRRSDALSDRAPCSLRAASNPCARSARYSLVHRFFFANHNFANRKNSARGAPSWPRGMSVKLTRTRVRFRRSNDTRNTIAQELRSPADRYSLRLSNVERSSQGRSSAANLNSSQTTELALRATPSGVESSISSYPLSIETQKTKKSCHHEDYPYAHGCREGQQGSGGLLVANHQIVERLHRPCRW